jgi:hypothetical protein
MWETELRWPAENFRDISYSEISLGFREIADDDNDKLYQIRMILEEYINKYFDETALEWWDTLDVSAYFQSSEIFTAPFLDDSWAKVRLWTWVESVVIQHMQDNNIDVQEIFGINVRNWILHIYYGERDAASEIQVDLTRSRLWDMYIHEITRTEIDALEESSLVNESITIVWGTIATISLTAYAAESRYIRRVNVSSASGVEIILEWRFQIPMGETLSEFHILDILELSRH